MGGWRCGWLVLTAQSPGGDCGGEVALPTAKERHRLSGSGGMGRHGRRRRHFAYACVISFVHPGRGGRLLLALLG